jgi:hypothetical protein
VATIARAARFLGPMWRYEVFAAVIGVSILGLISAWVALGLASGQMFPLVATVIGLLATTAVIVVWISPTFALVVLVVFQIGYQLPSQYFEMHWRFSGGQLFLLGRWREAILLSLIARGIAQRIRPHINAFDGESLRLRLRLGQAMLVYVAMCVLYMVPSGNPQIALFGLRTDAGFLLFFAACGFVRLERPAVRALIDLLLVLGGIVAGLGIILYYDVLPRMILRVTGLEFARDLGRYWVSGLVESELLRLTSVLVDPGTVAALLLVLLPLAWARWRVPLQPRVRGWLVVFAFVAIPALVLTYARSALGGLIGAALLAAFRNRQARRPLLMCLAAASMMVMGLGPLRQYVLETVTFREASSFYKVYAWIESSMFIIGHPLGIGVGGAGGVARRFSDVLENNYLSSENWYLHLGVEIGVLGAIVFIALMVYLIRYCEAMARAAEDAESKALFTALGFSTTALSIMSLGLPTWLFHVAAGIFWLVAGLIIYQIAGPHASDADELAVGALAKADT